MSKASFFALIVAISLLSFHAQAQAASDVHPEMQTSKKVAQFDADDSYDPFADYSDFDSAQQEEEDINFFRNGRFVTLGLILGYRSFTENLGSLMGSNINYGLFLSYFFDLRFAVQFSFSTGDHSFGFEAADGKHTGNVGIQTFGIDLKYYVNTQNVTKGLAKFNPYALIGFSGVFRTTNVSDTSAFGKDFGNAFDIGAGIELPLMRNMWFYGAQVMYQLVSFPGESTELTTTNGVRTGIYPKGDSYMITGIIGVNF